MIIIFEVAITIYFVVFQANFKEQFVPKLQKSIKDTYAGPLGLMYNDLPKPSPASLAWDFIMYNVNDFHSRELKFFNCIFQFQCCGVANKSDFTNPPPTPWNRTNPWGGLAFTYPLTCCPMGDVQQNWNSLPVEQLQLAANCAVYGDNIYEKVNLIFIDSTEKEI